MQGVVKPALRTAEDRIDWVGFRLIRALEARGRPMSLTELAKTVGMPASQAHLYLVSFAEEGVSSGRTLRICTINLVPMPCSLA